MNRQPQIPLCDGRVIPQLGFGVWQTPAEQTAETVRVAISAGYRSIDTAKVYGNEDGVGEGVRSSGVARDEIFVATKLAKTEQGYDSALRAFDESLRRTGLDYLDLYLIHWPTPRNSLFIDSWRALIRLKEEGRVRSIGVSNFAIEHLRRIIGETGVKPVLNQIELHPHFQQTDLRAYHAGQGIVTEAWSPLGRGRGLGDPAIARIAAKHGKSPAQTIIRWHLDSGLVAIPKSAEPSRIRENFAVFDFRLDADDMSEIAGLDEPLGRIGPDPFTFA